MYTSSKFEFLTLWLKALWCKGGCGEKTGGREATLFKCFLCASIVLATRKYLIGSSQQPYEFSSFNRCGNNTKDLSEEVCSCLAYNYCAELDWTQLKVVNRYLLWVYYVQALQYIIEETNYFHSSNGEKKHSTNEEVIRIHWNNIFRWL